mgnify:CR=1 FL=1
MNQMTLPFTDTNYRGNNPPANKWDAKFREFDKANPEVFELICDYVASAVDAGFSNYSMKLIINDIRWHENIKITDAFHAYYARKFVETFPDMAHFFNLRSLRCTEHA